MTEKLQLHYSPCPNDTFIFGGLSLGHIPIPGIDIVTQLADVEALNERAIQGVGDVIKVSYHAFLSLVNDYVLLDAGSALGQGVGPLLVSKPNTGVKDLAKMRIAIPGEYTTANLLLKLAYGNGLDTVSMVFSRIEDAVIQGEVDAGLIIHENRFTYQQRGLIKLADLGEYWESETSLPIPLGGIIAKRALGNELLRKIEKGIKDSIAWAEYNPSLSIPYIRAHAQEMDEKVMYDHIGLYVTRYSYSLGDEGREAINTLFEKAMKKGLIPTTRNKPFLD